VTEPLANARAEGGALSPAVTAGALLGAAREASGLSIDAVAQQLKLAPRQVRALEEDDFTHLPGRTFVRGFVRSYARLVRLDPDKVLGALPAGAMAPALEAPTLQPTAPTMGELPTTDHSKPGWARWAIPLTLAAVVAAAAVYEWMRPAGVGHPTAARDPAVVAASPAAIPAPPDTSGTPLPNPLGAGKPAAEPPPAAEPAPASSSAPGSAATPSAPAAEQPLTLAFKDYSWTEVRDRDGRQLLSGMNPGGTAQNVSGTPPFDIVIGNAADVRLTYKGSPVDLAPYTRQNVARLKLP
jgi:cytoskeleton protein RodZ